MAWDLMSNFQIGQQMGTGQNALATTINNVMEKIKSNDELRQKFGLQVGAAVETERQLGPMKMQNELALEREKSGLRRAQAADFFKNMAGVSGGQSDSGFGMTGYSYDPSDGNVKANFGQTPQGKTQETLSLDIQKRRQEAAEDLKSIVPILQQAEVLIGDLPTVADPSAKVFGFPGRAMSKMSESDPALASFESFLLSNRPALARAGGNRGNMTEPEQEAGISPLRSSNSTNTVRAKKLSQYYSSIIHNIADRSGRSPAEVASEMGMQYDPSTRRVTNTSIELIARGKKVKIPSRPGAKLMASAKDPNKLFFVYPDGTREAY